MSNEDLIFVKPRPGMTIRDPQTMLIMPEAGQFVHKFDYHYQSHINMGDLQVLDAPPEAEEHQEASPEPAAQDHQA